MCVDIVVVFGLFMPSLYSAILSLVLLGGIWFGTLLVVGAKLRGVRRIILVVREISTFLIQYSHP